MVQDARVRSATIAPISSNATTFPIYEKATGTLLAEIPTTPPQAIGDAVTAARDAGREWRSRPVSERIQFLEFLRRDLRDEATPLSLLLSRENGKPCHESLAHEIIPLLDAIDWIVAQAENTLEVVEHSPRWLKHRVHQIARRPRGVTAVLAPFNFPLLIAAVDSISALVAGCSVLLKPSEHCPLVATKFVEFAHRAGLPAPLLQLVQGGAETGRQLLAADVDAVVFTGSFSNGRKVAQACAERLIPYTLELGGNCPLLVLDDADLPRTAHAIVFGALCNSGQTCLGVGRVLVPRRLQAELATRIVEWLRQLTQGDPLLGDTHLGSLTTPAQIARCRSHVTQAQMTGATLHVGGEVLARTGNFFTPALLTDCHSEQLVYQEETFGPVIPLVPYDDLTTTVHRLNEDPAGLAAYVFGSDLKHASRVAERLDFGQVLVDSVLISYVCPEVPLSGLRKSGFGTMHGRDGMLGFSTPQVLGVPRLRLPAEVEFGMLEPSRARAVARTYLTTASASQSIKSTVGRFFKR